MEHIHISISYIVSKNFVTPVFDKIEIISILSNTGVTKFLKTVQYSGPSCNYNLTVFHINCTAYVFTISNNRCDYYCNLSEE